MQLQKEKNQAGAVYVETAISMIVFMFIIVSVIEILRFSFIMVSVQHVLNETLEHATKANFTVASAGGSNCGQDAGGTIEADSPEARLACIQAEATLIADKFGLDINFNDGSTEGYQLVVSYQDRESNTPNTALNRCQNAGLAAADADGSGGPGDLVALCIRAKNLTFFADAAVGDLDFIAFGRNEIFKTATDL